MPLIKFQPGELRFNLAQTYQILHFFFPTTQFTQDQIDEQYRPFAQGLLVEAIDASYEMGYVEILFRKFLVPTPAGFSSLRGLIKSFVKSASKHWFKNLDRHHKTLDDATIYESVRATVSNNFVSVFRIGLQTGDLTY
jgi:hypothetical protein